MRLYLRRSRARSLYTCFICTTQIARGATYYRDEPHPAAHNRQSVRHLCETCVEIIDEEGTHSARLWRRRPLPANDGAQINLQFNGAIHEAIIRTTQVRLISATRPLLERLTNDFNEIYRLNPDEFEEFTAERFDAMGFQVQRIGAYNRKDGSIDLIFVPKGPTAFPFIGAAQIKHHRSPMKFMGPRPVREFAAVLGAHPFDVGMLITNTTFTPDAKWFADHHAPLLRLRNGQDLRRWVASQFTDVEEWREIPTSIELCPGVVVQIPKLSLPSFSRKM
ncbi:MAG TPA: restriction endonuclease [Longimicrobium sp.]|nr:restriction endonuclease [Longimicrobium sp.]